VAASGKGHLRSKRIDLTRGKVSMLPTPALLGERGEKLEPGSTVARKNRTKNNKIYRSTGRAHP